MSKFIFLTHASSGLKEAFRKSSIIGVSIDDNADTQVRFEGGFILMVEDHAGDILAALGGVEEV